MYKSYTCTCRFHLYIAFRFTLRLDRCLPFVIFPLTIMLNFNPFSSFQLQVFRLPARGQCTLELCLPTAVQIRQNFALMLLEIKFETSALSARKATLKTTRSTLVQLCTRDTPYESPNFNPFDPTVFELHIILEQIYRMTQNDPEHY